MKSYPIEKHINNSIIDYCNSLQGKVIYNPNSVAKKISSMVAVGLLTEQQRKVYDCLSDKPKDTNTISKETKVDSVQVAIHLKNIYRMTQLISFKMEGKRKLWFK
jgi:DNA-binding CsgD family transcriptional regulator